MNDPLIKGGYIILSRKTIESEIFKKPPLYLKVWIYLLSIAQHKEYKKLRRGQLVTSIPEIQEKCCHYIGYRKVKPTRDQIYNILEWLRKGCEAVHESDTKAMPNTMTDTTMITTTKATQGMLINIDNYNVYQEPKNYESNNESNAESNNVTNNEKVTKATSKQREDDNINKNDKNDKNVNNEQEKKEGIPKLSPLLFLTNIHKEIFNLFGEASYATWFMDSVIKDQGELLIIEVDKEFKKNIIQNKYVEKLSMQLNKKISVKLKEGV
jgi:hypothetical protein